MRTTVDIPDSLYKRAKAKAAMDGVKLKELIARSLIQAMEPEKNKPVRKRIKFPLIKGDGKRVINPSPKELDASLWD